MFRRVVLLLIPLFVLGSPTDPLDTVPEIVKCTSGCTAPHQDACKKGCKFAYALTFAPSDYSHNPTCANACSDAYANEGETTACRAGCTHFQADVKHVQLNAEPINPMVDRRTEDADGSVRSLFTKIFSSQTGDSFFDRMHEKFMSMIHRMPSMFSGSSPEQPNGAEVNPNEPLIKTRVRIVFFSKPDEDSENPVIDTKVGGENPGAKLLDPTQLLSNDDKNTIVFKKDVTTSGICHKFLTRVNHLFGHPINLGLALVVSALVILFIMQVVLCIHRRSRRSRGHGYSRLPTYTEAVQIKLPVNDVDMFKPSEITKQPIAESDA